MTEGHRKKFTFDYEEINIGFHYHSIDYISIGLLASEKIVVGCILWLIKKGSWTLYWFLERSAYTAQNGDVTGFKLPASVLYPECTLLS